MFWILQISGWLLLATIYFLIYYKSYSANFQSFAGMIITHITGFLVTILLRRVYKSLGYKDRSIVMISFIILLGTVISANIWFLIDVITSKIVLNEVKTLANLTLSRYISLIWSNSFVLILWSALYFGIKLWNEWRLEKSRAEKADALAHKAQLQMLRYQLNPHFLFNSLNSIRALVEEDKSRAKSMITELSEFLRYSLLNEKLSFVPLKKELEAMKHYFAIEKTRFEEKLEVTFNIDPNTEDIEIPNFLIHPIIENAIKHGMKTSTLPLIILIKSKFINNTLLLNICNSGIWNDTNTSRESTGTGLQNVRQRLENAYPDAHEFKIIREESKICISIKIFNIN